MNSVAESHTERIQYLKSVLIGNQTTMISCNVPFVGPCNISFLWNISSGFNTLTLYDNGIPTYCKLPAFPSSLCPHAIENWTKVQYNISDYSVHKLAWCHENPFGSGDAGIGKIRVTYHIPPKFEHLSVSPNETTFVKIIKEIPMNINKTNIHLVGFNYSVVSSSRNVVLIITLPNTCIPLLPITPDLIKNVSNGLYKLEWINLKLDLSDIGVGKYKFIADDHYESEEKFGPNITIFADEIPEPFIDNVTSKAHNSTYCISLKSSKNITVTLQGSDDKINWTTLHTEVCSAGNVGLLCIDYWWNDSQPQPKWLRFKLPLK